MGRTGHGVRTVTAVIKWKKPRETSKGKDAAPMTTAITPSGQFAIGKPTKSGAGICQPYLHAVLFMGCTITLQTIDGPNRDMDGMRYRLGS